MKKYGQSYKQFRNLIQAVGSFGRYQKQLIGILFTSWIISGMHYTFYYLSFDLGNPFCNALSQSQCIKLMCSKDQQLRPSFFTNNKLPNTFPYLLQIQCMRSSLQIFSNIEQVSTIIGLLFCGWIATKYGKRKVIIFNNILLIIGDIILLVSTFFPSRTLISIGLALASMPHYVMSIVLTSLIPQITQQALIPLVIVGSLLCHNIGKLITVGLFYLQYPQYLLLINLCLLVLVSSVFLTLHRFYDESPRYLMDNDVFQAFIVFRKISTINKSDADLDVQNSFVINKVTIRKYSYLTLFQQRSIRLMSYICCVIMTFVGIINKYPNLILQLIINRKVEMLIMTTFQALAMIPCFLFVQVYNRRTISIYCSASLIILCISMFFITGIVEYMLKAAVLALILFFCMMLSTHIFVSFTEKYAHTIRCLALSLFLSCYVLGQSLANLALFWIKNPTTFFEMFLECAIIILLHVLPMKETKGGPLIYQIQEFDDNEEQNIFQ